MTVVDAAPAAPAPPPGQQRTRRVVTDVPGQIDRWFNRITLWSGLLVLVLLTLVGLFRSESLA